MKYNALIQATFEDRMVQTGGTVLFIGTLFGWVPVIGPLVASIGFLIATMGVASVFTSWFQKKEIVIS